MSIFWTEDEKKKNFQVIGNKNDFITLRESEDIKLESWAVTILGGMVLAIGILAMFFFLFLS